LIAERCAQTAVFCLPPQTTGGAGRDGGRSFYSPTTSKREWRPRRIGRFSASLLGEDQRIPSQPGSGSYWAIPAQDAR